MSKGNVNVWGAVTGIVSAAFRLTLTSYAYQAKRRKNVNWVAATRRRGLES